MSETTESWMVGVQLRVCVSEGEDGPIFQIRTVGLQAHGKLELQLSGIHWMGVNEALRFMTGAAKYVLKEKPIGDGDTYCQEDAFTPRAKIVFMAEVNKEAHLELHPHMIVVQKCDECGGPESCSDGVCSGAAIEA
jgi:hypothetical protein